ncbi:hypothetical protein FM036_36150 [Nostoc sp. HG1]|nr:hypothetical protein [Nostoc sp. HG1]
MFSPDPISELIGDTLHHSVRLQVFAPVLDSDENWDGDDSEDLAGEYLESASASELQFSGVEASGVEPDVIEQTAIASSECASDTPTTPEIVALNVEIAQALGLSMERLVAMTEDLSHQLIEEVFQFGDASSASETEQVSAASLSINQSLPNLTPDLAEARQNLEPPQSTLLVNVDARALEIVLEQETFQASVGQSVVVAGHLVQSGRQAPASTLSTASGREQPLNGESADLDRAIAVSTRWIAQELRLSLRNPQTSEVVLSDRLSFTTERLPYSFHFKVELPPNSTTHLLTGAIELWGADAEEAELVALQTVAITITVNPMN